MKKLISTSLVAISLLASGSALAEVSQQASELATKTYCNAKKAGNAVTQQAAVNDAAARLKLASGVKVVVNTACDGRPFAKYAGISGGAAAAGGLAALSVTTPVMIAAGVVATAAIVAASDSDNDPASPSK